MKSIDLERKRITEFLQWEDSNGHYTDDRCVLEGVPLMNYEEAVKFFFCVLNSEYYFRLVDNFFELDYKTVINVSKEQGFYDKTKCKLDLLVSEEFLNQEFYRSLLD